MLRRMQPDDVRAMQRRAFDEQTLIEAGAIVRDVRERGEAAVSEYAARFDGVTPETMLVIDHAQLQAACETISDETRALLGRTVQRIRRFADAQRTCLSDLTLTIPGGAAGHTIHPLAKAGCYVPGGRFPLVSSMLMTVATARAAGVERVWAASPNRSSLMLAAAHIAGADALLNAGGAHAVAALAFGAGPVPACDVVVGPGNRWVTAAKYIVSSDVRIDMLAGPSELLILADDSANPALVAADLLAQAEHDADACPMLVTTTPVVIDAVNEELSRQLEALPTYRVAVAAIRNGFSVVAPSVDEAVELCNTIAPEHLELHVRHAEAVATRIRGSGCVFIGSTSAEVFGDYGAGPNHTLPTGETARFISGLSVATFLRHQTWLRLDPIDSASSLGSDAIDLARLEGLDAHARSAQARQHPHEEVPRLVDR